MGLGSALLGGALAGYGAGVAKKGEMDWQERREQAMAKLTHEQDLDKAKIKQGYDQDNLVLGGKIDVATTTNQYNLMDRNSARQTGRDSTVQEQADYRRFTLDYKKVQQQFGQTAQLKLMDFAHDENMAQIALANGYTMEQLKSGQVAGIIVDENGNQHFYNQNGSTKPITKPDGTPVGSQPKTEYNPYGLGIVPPAAGAEPPAPTSGAKPTAAAPKAGTPKKYDGSQQNPYVAKTPEEADLIYSNPRNRGKYFRDPDGNLRQIPK